MSLPDLPTAHAVAVETVGRAEMVSGRLLVLIPFAAPTGPNRGRRYRVRFPAGPVLTRVVLSVGGRAALRRPVSAGLAPGDTLPVHLRATRQRRSGAVPPDLREALTAAGTSLAALSDTHVQQVLLMVGEARDPDVRAQRIQAAVQAATLAGHGS